MSVNLIHVVNLELVLIRLLDITAYVVKDLMVFTVIITEMNVLSIPVYMEVVKTETTALSVYVTQDSVGIRVRWVCILHKYSTCHDLELASSEYN